MATLLIWILTGLATAIYASAKNIHHMWLAPCGLMLDALERNEDFFKYLHGTEDEYLSNTRFIRKNWKVWLGIILLGDVILTIMTIVSEGFIVLIGLPIIILLILKFEPVYAFFALSAAVLLQQRTDCSDEVIEEDLQKIDMSYWSPIAETLKNEDETAEDYIKRIISAGLQTRLYTGFTISLNICICFIGLGLIFFALCIA